MQRGSKMMHHAGRVRRSVLLIIVLLSGASLIWRALSPMGPSVEPERAPPLQPPVLAAIARITMQALRDDDADRSADSPSVDAPVDVYAALRSRGRLLGSGWGSASNRFGGVEAAVRTALLSIDAGQRDEIDVVELSLLTGAAPLDLGTPPALPGHAHRGVRGLQVRLDQQLIRFPPTLMVARNMSFDSALDIAARTLRSDPARLLQSAEIDWFDAQQVLVYVGDKPRAVELFRGNRLVTLAEVTRPAIERSVLLMKRWMLNALRADGRMPYMYYPASNRESVSNNMIRQWMASLCLSRIATAVGDPALVDLATRNIRYNLQRFYHEEQGLGIIEYRGKVKLGAVALAALAMLEHPEPDQFAAVIDKLVATTDHLWREDGSFQTFYRPAGRSREANLHNFYPGETLLLWASLLQREADTARAARFSRSLDYYRQWHLAQRKPAFIPWHTQAYYLRWKQTRDPALRDWIFAMNDWLLGMQSHSRVAYDDTLGRFYDPAPLRAHFGPPHASSTGVYIEGLADAFLLARETGDRERAARYRDALLLGMRSVLQLQFADETDYWFAVDPERVMGGVRTTVYNNVIRIDNVQHNLMGMMKVLAAFDDQDFFPHPTTGDPETASQAAFNRGYTND
jgi:hypothetical protein